MWRGSRLLLVSAATVSFLIPSGHAAADFFTPETIKRFAPLLVIQKQEDDGPASAQWFLERSALRFAETAPCRDETIYPGPWSERQAARLGLLARSKNRWRHRNKKLPFCGHSGATLTVTDYTRPFDRRDEGGLNADEGFYLDFSGSRSGMDFTKDKTSHEFLTASPVYYDDGRLRQVGSNRRRPLAYITYWFFYAHNDAPPARLLWDHQGDWENMALLFERSADRSEWVLQQVAYAAHGTPQAHNAACPGDVLAADPLACPAPRASSQGVSRLVGFVAKGDHATYPAPGPHKVLPRVNDHTSGLGSGFAWPTWTALVPLESQPWAGFCGAWGKVGGSIPGTGWAWAKDRTGPLGPGCLNGKQQQRKSGRPNRWGTSRSSLGDRRAKPGIAVGTGL